MKLSEIATALNGKLVGKMENGVAVKAAIVIGFNMSSPKFQTPVKALGTTMNKIIQFDLVGPLTYLVTDFRTKKHRTMTVPMSEIEKVLAWDEIEAKEKAALKLEIEKIKHLLYDATSAHRVEYIAKTNAYATANGLEQKSFLAMQFETYEHALEVLAERCLLRNMNPETLQVSERKNMKGGRLELEVKDGKQMFAARVIIASGRIQRPHYRYLFL